MNCVRFSFQTASLLKAASTTAMSDAQYYEQRECLNTKTGTTYYSIRTKRQKKCNHRAYRNKSLKNCPKKGHNSSVLSAEI